MMNLTNKLQGIIGVINTPFQPDGEIHTPSLERYVDHSLDAGVCGFLTLGMAAETGKLTGQEKERIVTTVLERVDGRVPVIAGTSAGSQKERVNLARLFTDLGCNGIMVNIPFTDEKSYLRDLQELDAVNPGFIMVQDWDFKGYGLPVDLILEMAATIPSFKSLKVEVAPAGVKYTEVIRATGGELHVTGGWAATQMIEALDRGVHAFMPTILHPVYIRIFELHRLDRRREAMELFYQVLPVLSFSHQHVDISIHFNKRLVNRQGLFSTDAVRNPILIFDGFHERVAGELINYALKLNQTVMEQTNNQLTGNP
jgi:dihydrodipicolinate synthase/N-acetylneuraminate lyase